MSSWVDWEEKQNGAWEKFTAFSESVCEANIGLLDKSLIDFILKCYHSEEGVAALIRMQAIGMVITSVFGSVQEPLDIITNDEGWQKWSHMDDFNKASANCEGMPDLPYIWYRCASKGSACGTFYDIEKRPYVVNEAEPNVDFNVVWNRGKAFILEVDIDISELNEYQMKMYTGATPDKQRLDDTHAKLFDGDFGGHKHFVSRIEGIEDGKYDVNWYQHEAVNGVYIPVNKIHNIDDAAVRVVLPRFILEKYNIPIVD